MRRSSPGLAWTVIDFPVGRIYDTESGRDGEAEGTEKLRFVMLRRDRCMLVTRNILNSISIDEKRSQ